MNRSGSDPGRTIYAQQIAPAQCARCEPLRKDLDVEVAIIGAGMAGLSMALGLIQRGCGNIAVLEAGQPGAGASGRNGGFIMAGYSLPPERLLRQLGAGKARLLYRMTVEAQQLIKDRIGRLGIECGLTDAGIVLADVLRRPERLDALQRLMNRDFGADWRRLDHAQLCRYVNCEQYGEGLLEPQGAHFQPLAYVHGLAREIERRERIVYCHSRVCGARRQQGCWRLAVAGPGQEYRVRCRELVVCCGGYVHGLPLPQRRSILPIATYMVATEPLGELADELLPGDAAVYDTRFAFDYYRKSPGRRLLWGGRISVRSRTPDWIRARLKQDMARLFPQLAGVAIEYAWSGLMGYTRHAMPVIAAHGGGLWSAIGFGGHGVSTTAMAGELVAAAIAGGDDRYRLFGDYPAGNAYGPAGLTLAQLGYWGLRLRDGWLRATA